MATIPVSYNYNPANTIWEKKSPARRCPLAIKKIALAIIGAVNLAGVAAGLTFLVMNVHIGVDPITNVLFDSFAISGALIALTTLKFPTVGITSMNYKHSFSPLSIIARALTYTFFFPYMLVYNKTDWNPYHDKNFTVRVVDYLENQRFTIVAEAFGKHFKHLTEYGLIHEGELKKLQDYFKRYKEIKLDCKHSWKEIPSAFKKYEEEPGWKIPKQKLDKTAMPPDLTEKAKDDWIRKEEQRFQSVKVKDSPTRESYNKLIDKKLELEKEWKDFIAKAILPKYELSERGGAIWRIFRNCWNCCTYPDEDDDKK